uniref:Uncharacterized protein n=1 Tax=Corvus moneduloides TaxID=1196302 RepID=A0A8C3DCG8_CORMO
MGFPFFSFSVQKRDAPYSTTASRNRLDTAQMATTSHTFVAALAAPAPISAPAADRDDDDDDPAAAASAASAASTSDTLSVAVAERAGSPWSRTTISSRWRGPSASSSSPTRNGPLPRAPPAPPCSDPAVEASPYQSP